MKLLQTVLAAAVLITAASATAQTKWNMPSAFAEGNFHTRNLRMFVEDVDKSTNGQLKITMHSNASLFKQPEIKRAVQSGQAEIGEILLSAYSNEDPIFEMDAIPFLVRGWDNARKLMVAQQPAIDRRLAAGGMVQLFSVPWPAPGFYTKTELKTLDDLKGTKFRAPNTSISQFAELVGATPVIVQSADVPQAFATGMVGATIGSTSTGVDTQVWDYAKNFLQARALHNRNAVIVSKRALDALTLQVREQLMAAAKRAEERGWQMSQASDVASEKKLVEMGVVIKQPTPEMLQRLQQIGDTMSQQWLKKAGTEGEAILKQVRQ